MKQAGKLVLAMMLASSMLLTGCASLLEREYSTVEPHTEQFWESEAAGTLRAESRQDVVNDLLILISQHTEKATLRLYNYTDDVNVAEMLQKATDEVRRETPMGAYAVEYITTETQRQRGYDEVDIHIAYRRTQEQVQAMVNATSTAALPNLLDSAVEEGKEKLAVRVSYWGTDEPAGIDAMLADARERWGLTDAAPWTVSYYPSPEQAGIVELSLPTEPLPQEELPEGQLPEGAEPAENTAEVPGPETGEAAAPEADPGAVPAAEGKS